MKVVFCESYTILRFILAEFRQNDQAAFHTIPFMNESWHEHKSVYLFTLLVLCSLYTLKESVER